MEHAPLLDSAAGSALSGKRSKYPGARVWTKPSVGVGELACSVWLGSLEEGVWCRADCGVHAGRLRVGFESTC